MRRRYRKNTEISFQKSEKPKDYYYFFLTLQEGKVKKDTFSLIFQSQILIIWIIIKINEINRGGG